MSVYLERRDPSGNVLDIITDIISLDAAVAVNTVGTLSVTIPENMDIREFHRDDQLIVYNEVPGYAPIQFADSIFFLNKVTRKNDTIVLSAPDAMMILQNALVAATSETPYADKTQEEADISGVYIYFAIDDLMKAFVRENLASDSIDPLRNNSFVSVEGDRSLAPDGEKTASYANLLSTLQDLARMSDELGVPLFFSMFRNGENSFIFRVWSNQPRVDRSSTSAVPLVLLEENGDIDDVDEQFSWEEEVNALYGLGGGSGSSRVTTLRTNDVSLRGGPFSRREGTFDLRDVDHIDVGNQAYVDRTLAAALQGKRPRVRITAKVNDGGGYVFGHDFGFGDRISVVTGTRFYRQWDTLISAARLSFSDGKIANQIALTSTDFI